MSNAPQENKTNERKERVKLWLKDPYNLLFIGILLFAAIILLHYFSITKSQTLWWDEAEYMSTAKMWAFGVPYEISPQRPPLFSFMAFILYKLGFSESPIKFMLEIIPALLSILFLFMLIKKMYNPKTALISAFILSISWIHLFYSMRFMTDILGFLFGILAFLCFWKGYAGGYGKIYIWLIGFFVALSFLLRLTGILYGVFLLIFLLLTDKFRFLKDKNIWISLLVFTLTISPYLIWSQAYHGNALAFRSGYDPSVQNNTPLGWNLISLVYDYPEMGFFIFFIIGILAFTPMFLSLDILVLKRDKKYHADFFILLSILFTLAFFIYFLRIAENRWLIMMSIGIFVVSARGIILISEFIRMRLGRYISLALILLILVIGAYFQLAHADMIIKSKVDTYTPVKEAALWINQNSLPEDIVVTSSVPQITFYSERKIVSFYNSGKNEYYSPEEFTPIIEKLKPRYMVISIFEPSVPQWTYAYPQENPQMFIPVKAWFSDAEQKQPVLVIYEFNQSAL